MPWAYDPVYETRCLAYYSSEIISVYLKINCSFMYIGCLLRLKFGERAVSIPANTTRFMFAVIPDIILVLILASVRRRLIAQRQGLARVS